MVESHDQYLPDLEGEDYEALKADIKKRGQKVPVLCDQNGLVIDGRQRCRVCQDLDIPIWSEVVDVDKDTAQVLSRTLNTKRRQLDFVTKQIVAKRMTEQGYKDGQIAEQLNVSQPRISEVLAEHRNKIDQQIAEAVIANQQAKSGDGEGFKNSGPLSQRGLVNKLAEDGIRVTQNKIKNVAKDPESFKVSSQRKCGNQGGAGTGGHQNKGDVKARGEDAGSDGLEPHGQLAAQKAPGQKEAERMRDVLNKVVWEVGELDGKDVARQLHEHGLAVEDHTKLRRIAGELLRFCDETDDLED